MPLIIDTINSSKCGLGENVCNANLTSDVMVAVDEVGHQVWTISVSLSVI